MVDKLIITNESALTSKYGSSGLSSIQTAIQNLIASDAGRGISTEILFIDHANDMAIVGGAAVATPADEAGAKAAVDAAYAFHTPDYLVLFDGPDVVPHIDMDMPPGVVDDDLLVPSDLPYACDAPFSRDIADFLAVTRVVGRIPASEGATDSSPLVAMLEAAAAPRGGGDYGDPFAISADVWKVSTQLNADTVFGAGQAVRLSPPDGHPGIDPELQKLAHLINCHGGQASDEFSGEMNGQYPTAISSGLLRPNVRAGTVIAAECCYGAELYDFAAAGMGEPICIVYLSEGATAFVGSTNIAYGPAAGNSQADLMVQFFLNRVLAGASTGRALLEARQKFIRNETMSNPVSLKTIGQFLLLGDPSQHPVAGAAPEMPSGDGGGVAMAAGTVVEPAAARKVRRLALRGLGVASSLPVTLARERVEPGESLRAELSKLAESQGLAPTTISVFSVGGGLLYAAAAKVAGIDRKIAIVVDHRTPEHKIPSVVVLVAHISGDRIVRLERLVSR